MGIDRVDGDWVLIRLMVAGFRIFYLKTQNLIEDQVDFARSEPAK